MTYHAKIHAMQYYSIHDTVQKDTSNSDIHFTCTCILITMVHVKYMHGVYLEGQ